LAGSPTPLNSSFNEIIASYSGLLPPSPTSFVLSATTTTRRFMNSGGEMQDYSGTVIPRRASKCLKWVIDSSCQNNRDEYRSSPFKSQWLYYDFVVNYYVDRN